MSAYKKAASRSVSKLAQTHKDLIEQTDRLNNILINLRYEGKTKVGKNLKEVWDILTFFEKEVDVHVEVEEKCLFPFLITHVPRLEPLITLFHSEHEDFRKNLREFRLAMENLCGEKSEPNKPGLNDKVREVGTYLIYLLRQHLAAEGESLYKTAEHELHEEEKRELDEIIELNCHPPA